jgi:hypothetical protein
MKKTLRGKLTYANVTATLALFLVLSGGAAYAASQLAKNSVGTKQIKNDAITTGKIKNEAVTGAKIKLSSIGTVPSATKAVSAEDAGKLGGSPAGTYRDRCPTGTSSVASGLCMTEERGAAGWGQAIEECGEVGLRLPTPGETRLMASRVPSNHPFWTDDFYASGGVSYALVYWPAEKGLFGVNSSGGYWIYCVTTPTNS